MGPGFMLEHYEIRDVRGGTEVGIEYLAHDHEGGTAVAILEFLPESIAVRGDSGAVEPIQPQNAAQFETMLGTFLDEAAALAQCDTPNINAIRRSFRANGTGYVVAECPGETTLDTILSRGGALGGETLQLMLPALLDGLGKLHEAGLLHLDIRPANIMLRDDGSAVLRGFGAVPMNLGSPRQSFGGSRQGRHAASALSAYTPIELYSENTPPGPWSDIYFLGATLYHCITGEPPPAATDRVLADSLTLSADNAPPGIGSDLLSALAAATAIVPTERPRSIAIWKDQFFGGPPSGARAPAGARFVRAAARGGRIAANVGGARGAEGGARAGKEGSEAKDVLRWSVPALALTATTAAIAFIDVGVLRPEGDLIDREPSLVHLSMAGRTEALTYEAPDPLSDAAASEPETDGTAEPLVAVQDGATLVVDTVPPNVEVLVAGRMVGYTPLRQQGLSTGVHDVTLQHPHYESVELDGQEFLASQELRIERTLARGIGNLLITTDPPGAWVELDGERVMQSTPGTLRDLPAGPLEIRLGAPGRSPTRVAAEVPRGGTGYLARILPIAYGTLEVELDPADARIVVSNEVNIDYSYDPGMRLPQGTYLLEVSKPGYQDVARTVSIDGETSIKIELLPQS